MRAKIIAIITFQHREDEARRAIPALRAMTFHQLLLYRMQLARLGDALDRAQRAFEAGADALFVEGPRSREEIERIPGAVDAPFLLNLV